MPENLTFGCGAFLPGFGPGNFPEFDGGGTIDSPGGDDPPTTNIATLLPTLDTTPPTAPVEPGPGPGNPPGVPTGPRQPAGPSSPAPAPAPPGPGPTLTPAGPSSPAPPAPAPPGPGGPGPTLTPAGPSSPAPPAPAPPGPGGPGPTAQPAGPSSPAPPAPAPPGPGGTTGTPTGPLSPVPGGPTAPGGSGGGGGGGILDGGGIPIGPGGEELLPGGEGGDETLGPILGSAPGEGLIESGDPSPGPSQGTLGPTLTPSTGGGLIESGQPDPSPSQGTLGPTLTPSTGEGLIETGQPDPSPSQGILGPTLVSSPQEASITSLAPNQGNVISSAINEGEIDLNNAQVAALINGSKPTGIEDPDISFVIAASPPRLTRNRSTATELFNREIDSNIEYVLSNKRNYSDWDSTKAGGITPESVFNSLKPSVQNILNQILNYDGTPITKNQIFALIGTRILDGTIKEITLGLLQKLAEDSKTRKTISIRRSTQDKINEVAALALTERSMFSLDQNKVTDLMKHILPNWKTLASDTDKHIQVKVDGVLQKFYIKDDNTFIDRNTLSIKEGDYYNIKRGPKVYRIPVRSEKDHAFLIPEKTRQMAINLLGGEGGRTLEVSASILSNIEFDYSLSSPRQNFYVLSCVLSSIDTKPNLTGSFLLKNSSARYELMDTVTTAGMSSVNNFIKYKANHRVFIMDDEDVMLDYIEGTSALTLKQTDILFDSPKENKNIPLLTRQIPWYILVYPTNRSSLNIFKSRSKIIQLEASGPVVRQLKFKTSIVPELSKRHTNKFVRLQLAGVSGVDVSGNPGTQHRITQIDPTDKIFSSGYRDNDTILAASAYTPNRKKTGFRLLKEIITELDTNYLLAINGIGKSLTEFDVFSRLNLHQFNALSRLENFSLIRDSIRAGVIAGVKVIPAIKAANKAIAFNKTLLFKRKADATKDTFAPKKSSNAREDILPPTVTEPPRRAPVVR